MTWLFSQALVKDYENSRSLPALVEESSAATCSDGEPSAQLNVMPTQHKFWRNDKTMEPSSLSRFGLTCAVLTADRGEELLTWYRAGFPVRTSASPAPATGLKVSDLGSGESSRGWFATFSPDSSTWRTAQLSLLGDSESFSETWPRWGSMRDGASYLQPTPALPICESESGLWPTPTVPNGGRSMSQEMALNGGYTKDGVKRQIGLENAVKYWPTPVSSDTGRRSKPYAQGGTPLSLAVQMWPTPTASLGTKGGRVTPRKSREGGTLIEAVSARQTWATATARDWRSGKASQATHDKNSRPLSEQVGGLLNPTWVEWLMAFPSGWTDLRPLEMHRFREWQQQHGECSEAAE